MGDTGIHSEQGDLGVGDSSVAGIGDGANQAPVYGLSTKARRHDKENCYETKKLRHSGSILLRFRYREHLTGIREVEVRIAAAGNDPVTPPSGIPFDYAEYVKLMFNPKVIAFQSGLTRVSTMMPGREGSVRTRTIR